MSAALLLADFNGDMDMDWNGGWWIVMAIGFVLFWGLVILGIVWLVRELGSRGGGEVRRSESDPLAILDRRLAEGAITPEEYRQRREILSGRSAGTGETG